jgi:RNA-directed DNA polymerase
MASADVVDAERGCRFWTSVSHALDLPSILRRRALSTSVQKRLQGARHPQADGTAFDFLGLTHVWGRSRKGKDMVRQLAAMSQ